MEGTTSISGTPEPGLVCVRVRKVRSSEHLDPKRQGTIRALGLQGRIGKVNILPDTPSTWGQIRKVEYLVVATRAQAKHGVLLPVESSMTTRRYELGPGDVGTRIDHNDEGMAWIEERNSGHAVTWRAQPGLSPDKVARSCSKLFSRSVAGLEATAYDDAGNHWRPAGGLLRDASADAVRVVTYRVSERTEVLWQRSFEDPTRVEIGVVGDVPSQERLIGLVQATGAIATNSQLEEMVAGIGHAARGVK